MQRIDFLLRIDQLDARLTPLTFAAREFASARLGASSVTGFAVRPEALDEVLDQIREAGLEIG